MVSVENTSSGATHISLLSIPVEEEDEVTVVLALIGTRLGNVPLAEIPPLGIKKNSVVKSNLLLLTLLPIVINNIGSIFTKMFFDELSTYHS